jgi:hypothetical protein
MTRRTKLWRVAAALFFFINVAGAAYAVAMGEPMHALVHAVLLTLALGAYSTWRVSRPVSSAESPRLSDDRMSYLQQSVDALALEVERIGEKQRFGEKLRSEQGSTAPPKKEQ